MESPRVTEPLPSFGALLIRHRLAAALTQEALAERAGLSARAISDLERGVAGVPQQATVVRLAAALGLGASGRAALQAAARHLDGRSVSLAQNGP
jgi:transcriptional regulator with XRE-family HTH domain